MTTSRVPLVSTEGYAVGNLGRNVGQPCRYRFAGGERLGRACGQLFMAPLAQLPRADIQFSGDVRQRPATLDHTLNRLGLILTRKPSPGSSVCHSALLGCSGSLQNPPLRGGKSTS